MNKKGTYRVTAYHEYGIAQISRHHFDFRWYWQANAVSFLLHHLLGYSCNTWKKQGN